MRHEELADARYITGLLRRLRSYEAVVRESAIGEVQSLSPERLRLLAEAIAGAGRWVRLVQGMKGATGVAGLIGVLWGICYPGRTPMEALLIMSCLVASPWGLWSIWNLCDRLLGAQRSLAAILERSNDLRFLNVGLALLKQNASDRYVRHTVGKALRRMLPQLRTDHACKMTPEQKAALLIPLERPYDDIELTLATLKALEQVGDERAIPTVEAVLQLPVKKACYLRVWQGARDCLLFLQEHQEERRQAQTLLRPSAWEIEERRELLRPTSATEETPPEQLLRVAP